jgi:hypothetical protein
VNIDIVRNVLAHKFGADVRVQARRPLLAQILLPAYLADGDAVDVFVRLLPDGRLRVTDLGKMRMRASYVRDIDTWADSEIERLAAERGFGFEGGEAHVDVRTPDLVGAVFGLLQLEAAVAAAVRAPRVRSPREEAFPELVKNFLSAAFSDRCHLNVHDDETDPDGNFAVDAIIEGRVRLGIAAVSTDLIAERAIGTQAHASELLRAPVHRWAVICRDAEALSSRTRRRLLQTYPIQFPTFEELRPVIATRIRDLADLEAA